MDDICRHIVAALIADGRVSQHNLGKLIGLSTSAVHQRVQKLEERGVLRGFRAVVDPEALGLSLTAFISVKPIDPAAPDDVPDRLKDLAEVEDCYSVAGDENYILKVRVGTAGELESLLSRIRVAAEVSTRTA